MANDDNLPPAPPTRPQHSRLWAAALTYGLALAAGAAAAWGLFAEGQPATLAVYSRPPGANVFLDGTWRGVTPLAPAPVPRGEHHLCLTKHGFARHVESLNVRRPLTHLATLRPLRSLSVAVQTDPPGAQVQVQGRPVGKTPLTLDGLDPGPLTLTIEKDGYEPIAETVIVKADETVISRKLLSKSQAYFQSQIAERPKEINNYTELAHHYMVKGQYDEAVEVLSKGMDLAASVNTDPVRNWGTDVARFYQELAKIHRQEYSYGDDKAVERMRAEIEKLIIGSIERHPDCTHNYKALTALYRGNATRGTAIDLLADAVKRNPGNTGLQTALAGALMRSKRYKEAAEAFTRLAEKQPKNAYVRQSLANALVALHRRKDALVQLEAALKLATQPKHRLTLLNALAQQNKWLRQYEQALAYWEQAIKIDPNRERACHQRLVAAYHYRRLKAFDRARTMYEAALAESKNKRTRRSAQLGLKRLKAAQQP